MWFWLRRMVRRHSSPIPMTTAEKWHFRLSLFYGFLAWNAGGFTLYMIFTGKKDWPGYYGLKEEVDLRPPSEQFADLLKIKKAHVIQFSGFKKVNEFDINNNLEEKGTDETESQA